MSNIKTGKWGGRVTTLEKLDAALRELELDRLRELAALYPDETRELAYGQEGGHLARTPNLTPTLAAE